MVTKAPDEPGDKPVCEKSLIVVPYDASETMRDEPEFSSWKGVLDDD